MQLNPNHITYSARDKVQQLLAPLKEIANLGYFSYGVNFPDKSCFTLISHPEYYEKCWNSEFPLWGFFLESGWHLWETTLPEQQQSISSELGIGKGIIHVNHQADRTVIVEFASTPENKKAYDFYLNRKDLLISFMGYFSKHAGSLIREAQQQLVKPLPHMVEQNEMATLASVNLDPFRHYLFEGKYPISLLSEREYQCFCMLLKGYSIADIAEKLALAIPTIANYIARIKNKLGCSSRREMWRLAQDMGLVNIEAAILAEN